MQSVGQILRNARLAQGRTLDQVRASTRIPLRSLEAIEADELAGISSAFLYKSFARQFAEDVGLDYAPLESMVKAAAGTMPTPLIPGQSDIAAPKVAALRIGKHRNSRWLYSFGSFALVLVACSTVYSLWQSSRFSLPSSLTNSAKPLQTKDKSASANPGPVPRVRFAEMPSPSVGGAEPAESNGGLTIEISATEPTWVAAFADGKRSFSGTLETAQSKILEGRETARIRTGNAGGVNVVFNGRSLGALGPRGQIRTVLFTKGGYEVVDGPAHIALTDFTPIGEEEPALHPLALLPAF